jgi:peptide chain release factor 2
VERWDRQRRAVDDAGVLLELAEEASDDASAAEAEQAARAALVEVEAIEFSRMLAGPYDHESCILSINAGAGGTESQDWAEMLLRMYLHYCEDKGWGTEVIDRLDGDDAGIKNCTVMIRGEFSYGHLRAENGVHRLVRISPYDAAGRRHTSFASVFVIPDIEEDVEVEIRDEDLRIDVFRSGGAGGQHVNKTESAVRITHLPTNTVVICQNERSQHKNKGVAMRVLKARLLELERRKQEEKLGEFSQGKQKIDFGSQIRSYVLAPYRLVKDHRTDVEMGDVEAVLNGKLDKFVHAFLLETGGKGLVKEEAAAAKG